MPPGVAFMNYIDKVGGLPVGEGGDVEFIHSVKSKFSNFGNQKNRKCGK
jgi:hypothetical protein